MNQYDADAVKAFVLHSTACRAYAETQAWENGAADQDQADLWAALYLAGQDVPCTCPERAGPELGTITRHAGIAGQYAYSVLVTYPGEAATPMTFVGSVYGGRVVVTWPAMPGGVFVAAEVMDRCGPMLTPEWVRRYFQS